MEVSRADTGGAILKLRLREFGASMLVGTPAISSTTLTQRWEQISVSIVPHATGHSLDLTAYVPSASPGTCFYADDASITSP